MRSAAGQATIQRREGWLVQRAGYNKASRAAAAVVATPARARRSCHEHGAWWFRYHRDLA